MARQVAGSDATVLIRGEKAEWRRGLRGRKVTPWCGSVSRESLDAAEIKLLIAGQSLEERRPRKTEPKPEKPTPVPAKNVRPAPIPPQQERPAPA